VDEPILIVNIESPLVEDLQQQVFIIGSSCCEQPLICGCVAPRCVNACVIPSIRNVLFDAPLESIFKEVEAKKVIWGREAGDSRNTRSGRVDDLDQLTQMRVKRLKKITVPAQVVENTFQWKILLLRLTEMVFCISRFNGCSMPGETQASPK